MISDSLLSFVAPGNSAFIKKHAVDEQAAARMIFDDATGNRLNLGDVDGAKEVAHKILTAADDSCKSVIQELMRRLEW